MFAETANQFVEKVKHEYLRSRAYICLSLSSSDSHLSLKCCTFHHFPYFYRDTRAYILDPCIQEFFQIRDREKHHDDKVEVLINR